MEVLKCTKSDFDQIITEINDFWDSDRTLSLHHPMFIYEFGNSAYVIREANNVVAYLFGFLSQTGPVGYVHLIAVRQTHRLCGYGHRLYAHFAEFAKKHGCETLKAIITPSNTTSIAFHKSIGMEPIRDSNCGDFSITKDYAGPGADRLVLEINL